MAGFSRSAGFDDDKGGDKLRDADCVALANAALLSLMKVSIGGKAATDLGLLASVLGRIRTKTSELLCSIASAAREEGVDASLLLGERARLGKREIRRMKQTAEHLEAMPNTSRRLSSGKLTFEHAAALAEAAKQCGPGVVDGEQELLDLAENVQVDRFTKEARTFASQHSPDLGQSRLERQRRQRRAWMFIEDETGMGVLRAWFDPVSFNLVSQTLDIHTDALWRSDGGRDGRPDSVRTPSQRRCDALFELITEKSALAQWPDTGEGRGGEGGKGRGGEGQDLRDGEGQQSRRTAGVGRVPRDETGDNHSPRGAANDNPLRPEMVVSIDSLDSETEHEGNDSQQRPEKLASIIKSDIRKENHENKSSSDAGIGGLGRVAEQRGSLAAFEQKSRGRQGNRGDSPAITPADRREQERPGQGQGNRGDSPALTQKATTAQTVPRTDPPTSPARRPALTQTAAAAPATSGAQDSSGNFRQFLHPAGDSFPATSDRKDSGGGRPALKAKSRAQLVVVVDIGVIDGTRRDGRCELLGTGPVPPEILRTLTPDSELASIIFGGKGLPLWLGRQSRLATGSQRLAVAVRDRGCVLCDKPMHLCEIHHVREWGVSRGRTDIDNLVALCGDHHRMLHNNDMHLVRTPEGWTPRPRPPNGSV